MKYLFIMAHPDDEVDVGGTIYKLVKQDNEVAVVILVSEVKARNNLSSTLALDELKSMNILGVSKVYHAGFPNIKTNTVPHLELVKFIESCIYDWGARAIITHHTADVNIDHMITSEATVAACRLFQRKEKVLPICLLLFCETAGATEWALDSSKNRFVPNWFVDIGKDGLEIKLKALNSYNGVSRLYPHPYSYEAYEGLATCRGVQAGVEYAEAFYCVFRSELMNEKNIKRLFDICFAIVVSIFGLPIIVVFMIVIKICSPESPVIFKQVRIGYKRKPFTILKLRTMTNECDEKGELLPDEERLKTWGKIIRRLSIDELIQIVHIFSGEMSWIGPRPLLPREMLVMTEEEQEIRQSVMPGITGWEAVNEEKSDNRRTMAEYDLYYARNWSIGFDAKIFFMTIAKLFKADRSDDKHRAPKLREEELIISEKETEGKVK